MQRDMEFDCIQLRLRTNSAGMRINTCIDGFLDELSSTSDSSTFPEFEIRTEATQGENIAIQTGFLTAFRRAQNLV